jgi:hypothetical protein
MNDLKSLKITRLISPLKFLSLSFELQSAPNITPNFVLTKGMSI